MTKKDKKEADNFIEAYKKVRKPTAPPSHVLPDKRTRIDEHNENEEYKEYEEIKNLEKTKRRANVFVSGRVQGVFFRGAAVEKALEAGLTGWVRNRVDGRLEALLEGDQDTVRGIIDWFHTGPPTARVENVEVFWENATGEFTGFDQRHTF